MPNSYPNQRIITINREAAKSDFLGIKNENWKAASCDLGPHALRLYFYLAANANGFTLALSPADLLDSIGMARSTYYDQFRILVNKGYLVERGGNRYTFFEVPQKQENKENKSTANDGFNSPWDEQGVREEYIPLSAEDIEINNRDNETDSDKQLLCSKEVKQGEFEW